MKEGDFYENISDYVAFFVQRKLGNNNTNTTCMSETYYFTN